MAVCLDYQTVYYRRQPVLASVKLQIAAAILLLAAIAGKVWMRIEATEYGYRLAKARQQTIELDMERRELELQLSVLRRPDNLAKSAKKRLGLQPIDPKQVWKVEG